MAVRREKVCCRCGETKAATDYYRRGVAQDGLSPACKACLRDRRRARRAMTATEKAAEGAALAARPTKVCGVCDIEKSRDDFNPRSDSRDGLQPLCKECAREKSRRHYVENRQKRREQAATWYEANKARRAEQRAAWYAANQERARLAQEKWYEQNPGYRAEAARLRRARIAGATVGPIDLDALWTGVCALCDEVLSRDTAYPHPLSPSVDHIFPIARGGEHAQRNLQWTHLICNQRKSASLPADRSA